MTRIVYYVAASLDGSPGPPEKLKLLGCKPYPSDWFNFVIENLMQIRFAGHRPQDPIAAIRNRPGKRRRRRITKNGDRPCSNRFRLID